jgi:hypothetical protein
VANCARLIQDTRIVVDLIMNDKEHKMMVDKVAYERFSFSLINENKQNRNENPK